MREIKRAFTLPEVLIVIGIIGVVAAILMPTVIREFELRSNSYREANIANKVTQAMELMNAAGDLHYYQTTEEFVDALKKHLKVIKVCTPENIEECWSSKTVTTSTGESFEVKNVKKAYDLHINKNTDLAGLILADGAQILLTYNPEIGAAAGDNITPSKKNLPVGFGKTKEFAYTTSVTGAIDFVMDVNGTAGPNAETSDDGKYNDIRSFRAASFTAGCLGYKFNGVCVYDIGTNYKSIACTENSNIPQYCKNGDLGADMSQFITDYWAGARKSCDEIGMRIPSYEDLKTILSSSENSHKSEHSGTYFTARDQHSTYVWGVVSSNPTGNAPGVYKNTKAPVICIRK